MTELETWQLAAIRAGDTGVFSSWLAGAEPVLRRALRPFAAMVDTEAVLQEGLLKVWQVAPTVKEDGRPEVLLRFAHTVVRNQAVSEARRLRTLPAGATPPPDSDPPVELSPPDPMLRERIGVCRDKLPGKPKSVLKARLEAEGNTHDGVLAEGLGMSLNTFLQNFTRARKLLAECLKKAGVDLALELSP
jgi:DNA-directed RNA polymerase specialized sigma24 family protein